MNSPREDNNHVVVNFTPTGMIPTKDKTRHVPVTADEIVEEVHQAYEIGITLVHLHARSEDERPTYKASIYETIFNGVRRYCPDLVICASLSGRNFPEIEKRTEVLRLQPDMGSLTLSSLNFPQQASINSPETINQLVSKMNEFGVKPELECFDSGMINYSKYLIAKGLIKAPFYYNIIVGNLFNCQADLGYMGLMIKDLPQESLWAFGGIGKDQLKANGIAIAAGGGVRIGLEDNIWYDNKKTKLASNIALIKRVHNLAQIFERNIMSSLDFGQLGFYNRHRKVREEVHS